MLQQPETTPQSPESHKKRGDPARDAGNFLTVPRRYHLAAFSG